MATTMKCSFEPAKYQVMLKADIDCLNMGCALSDNVIDNELVRLGDCYPNIYVLPTVLTTLYKETQDTCVLQFSEWVDYEYIVFVLNDEGAAQQGKRHDALKEEHKKNQSE